MKDSSAGSTRREATIARKISVAVRMPYVANKGMGAKPIMVKPTILETPDAIKADPVPWPVFLNAWSFESVLLASSLKRCVMCIE